MPNLPPDNVKASARSPLAGCTILIAALLVMVFLVAFSIYALFRQYREIEKFTAEKPVPVEVAQVEDREPELNRLVERLEDFRQGLHDGEEEVTLALDANELNLAIAAFAPLSELRGTFRVERVDEQAMRIAISFPLNGRPRLATAEEDGWVASDPRFLNGTMVAEPLLLNHEIVLAIQAIEVEGAKVPIEFVEQMSPYRITQRYVTDPMLGPAMERLTSLALEDGRLVLRRVPGEKPTDEITPTQVDASRNRLFGFFAIGASIFLILVGLVLFIGLRSKGRQA